MRQIRLGAGTVQVLLGTVQHVVQVIHMIAHLWMSWYSTRASGGVSLSVVAIRGSLQLGVRNGAQLTKHPLHGPGQSISPSTLRHLELDLSSVGEGHPSSTGCLHDPLKLSIGVVMDLSTSELRERASKDLGNLPKLLVKDKSILTNLIVLKVVKCHLQKFNKLKLVM